jgi:anti-sigma factor RsiW
LFKCSDIEKRLMEILEGNLDQVGREAVAKHLVDCPECRDLVAHYQPLFKIDTTSPSPAPASLWRAVQTRLNELEEGRRSQPTLFPNRRSLFGYALQTLGVAAAIIAGVFLGKTPESTQVTYEEEIVSYYAGALSESALPISEVYTQVSNNQGDSK